MKFKKKFLIIAIIFAIANLFLFVNRNRGFEYQKFSSLGELYPEEMNNSFLKKWTGANQHFSAGELETAKSLLKKEVGIDTIETEKDKALKIAEWMYKLFYLQLGKPSDTVSKLTPFQQYFYLVTHKKEQLWCGNFQRMFGFFCTASELPNRYVEVVPVSALSDFHEVNEVYLAKEKKWMMVDVTRNILSIQRDHEPVSAAVYLNIILQKKTNTLFIIRSDSTLYYGKHLVKGNSFPDNYFNKDHILRYYFTMDLSQVYATIPKIKRYIFADPWYEMYDPVNQHSNLLFRIKQFFIFGFIISMLLLLFPVTRFKS